MIFNSGRFILFLFDSKFKEHDGKIFSSYQEAKNYAAECISEKYCEKFAIGFFSIDINSKEMLITSVETFGFSGDKKNVNQLELFK